MSDFSFSMNISAKWFGNIIQDEGLLYYLHANSGSLARGLRVRIVNRANNRYANSIDDVNRRGAFNEDITVKTVPYSRSKNNLVKAYTGHDWQEALWGRVYDIFVEGPPLGETTYTNPPRHIFADIELLDGPYISSWVSSNAAIYYATLGAI